MAVNLWGIGVVKNESDVIGDSVDHALTYCDQVHYLDNNSTDGTWEILQKKIKEHPRRFFAERYEPPYTDGVRREIYNRFNDDLPPDHWWIKLDADEFLHQDPHTLLEGASTAGADGVVAWQVQFLYTDVDHRRYTAGDDDPALSIVERRRFYRTNWREPRIWRNFPGEEWSNTNIMHPEQVGKFHSQRPLNRHYQYRSPEQIQTRIDIRRGSQFFTHVESTKWEQHIVSAASCAEWVPGTDPTIHYREFYQTRIRQKIRSRLGRSNAAGGA